MRSATLVLGCILLVSACRNEPEPEPAAAPAPPTPAQVTPATFQTLRWLEGHWRGTGGGVPTFYEGYRFVDDTTIQALMFTDSTLTQVADSGRIVLSQGVVTSRGENSASVVTEIDSNRVHFEPQENANNAFTWTRESATAWTAVLTSSVLGRPQERVYRMERIESPPR